MDPQTSAQFGQDPVGPQVEVVVEEPVTCRKDSSSRPPPRSSRAISAWASARERYAVAGQYSTDRRSAAIAAARSPSAASVRPFQKARGAQESYNFV